MLYTPGLNMFKANLILKNKKFNLKIMFILAAHDK